MECPRSPPIIVSESCLTFKLGSVEGAAVEIGMTIVVFDL